jgi:uracil-DNA glycosylase
MLTKYFDRTWIDAVGEDKLMQLLTDINYELKPLRRVTKVLPLAGDEKLFKAFRLTPYDKVKVVIIGQDPYHDGSFNGVAFGNGEPGNPPKKISPSLRNILKEVERSYGDTPDPSLYSWAKQGVLLINTAHTVEAGNAGSHLELWEAFTNAVLAALIKKDNLVWMFWGNQAKKYDAYKVTKHTGMYAGHPSPLNRVNPFVGSDIFTECDKILGNEKIKWYE